MRCPICGGDTKVIGSRADSKYVYRYRKCLECENHFFSTEFIDEESKIAYNKAMKFILHKPGMITDEFIIFRAPIGKVRDKIIEPKTKKRVNKLLPVEPIILHIDGIAFKCCPTCFKVHGEKNKIGLGKTTCLRCRQKIKPV